MSTATENPKWSPIVGSGALTKSGEELYYIQNKGFVGNCLRWWASGGHGYTCDLLKAWRVPLAQALHLKREGEDVLWPVSKAEALVQWHVMGGGAE